LVAATSTGVVCAIQAIGRGSFGML